MSGFRTVVSAICTVLAAVLGVVWIAAQTVVRSVDERAAVHEFTQSFVEDPQVLDAAVGAGTARVTEALSSAGIEFPGLDLIVGEIVNAVVYSDAFASAAQAQAASAADQLLDSIKDESGPMVVTIDISDAVNERLEQIPFVGSSLPDITIAPIPVEVANEEEADGVRTAYDRLQWAATWAGWLALGLLVLGLIVSHRRRWYPAKAALALGVASAVGWALVTYTEPGTVLASLPGGLEGTGPADVVSGLVDDAATDIASVLGFVAIGAMIIAVVLFGAARATQGAGSKRG